MELTEQQIARIKGVIAQVLSSELKDEEKIEAIIKGIQEPDAEKK